MVPGTKLLRAVLEADGCLAPESMTPEGPGMVPGTKLMVRGSRQMSAWHQKGAVDERGVEC